MFSLIISIISIALVAALAAATVYFGGAAFNKGAAGADASAFINAGQQIAGAFTLASSAGVDVDATTATVASLNSGLGSPSQIYLAQIPTYKGAPFVLDTTNPTYVSQVVQKGVCDEVNNRKGSVPGEATPAALGLYGCVTASDVSTSYYKVK